MRQRAQEEHAVPSIRPFHFLRSGAIRLNDAQPDGGESLCRGRTLLESRTMPQARPTDDICGLDLFHGWLDCTCIVVLNDEREVFMILPVFATLQVIRIIISRLRRGPLHE